MKRDNTAYKYAVGVALAAAFLLFWLIGAVGINGVFVALFVGSALLFRQAARKKPLADAGRES